MANQVQQNQAEEEQELPVDTSNPEQVNKSRKKSARTRADRLRFVDAAMDTKEGRSWFYDILKRCRVFGTPYISGDPHATSFRCGEQNIGLQILDDIQTAASDMYVVMVKEAKENKED